MDILTGMSGLKTGIELLRSLREALKSGQMKPDEVAGRIGEIYDYIVDSKDALVDAKDEIQTLRDEIRQQKEQVRELERKIAEEHTFVFLHGAYWVQFTKPTHHTAEEGIPVCSMHYEGPYCPTCKDADSKSVRLRDLGRGAAAGESQYYCDIHKITFYIEDMP
jgi:hypothetical protein